MLDPDAPMVWRNDRKQAGAGVLADMGSHGIDCARYLLGDIAAVSGANRLYVRERPDPSGTGRVPVDAEDACVFAAEFVNGAIGTFDLNRAVAGLSVAGAPFAGVAGALTSGKVFPGSFWAVLEVMDAVMVTIAAEICTKSGKI